MVGTLRDRPQLANEDGNDIDFQLPPAPQLLYESVEAIFNHKNLWISRTLLDPAVIRYLGDRNLRVCAWACVLRLAPLTAAIIDSGAPRHPCALRDDTRYDFEESGEWSAFVEPRMQSLGKPEAFYSPKRLSAKVPPDRLRSMEAQILGELKTQVCAWVPTADAACQPRGHWAPS